MKVYSKYKLDFNKYPVGNFIGGNADGEVFSSGENVIKFTEIKDSKKNANIKYFNNKKAIEYIIDNDIKHFCKIYDFGLVKVFENDYRIIYFYLMEKLNPLSDDERKVFHSTISHEDFNKIKNFDEKRINNIVNEMSHFFDFDKQKVTQFINEVQYSNVKHLDIHPRNIMKDNFGNFKFIDFDRIQIRKLK